MAKKNSLKKYTTGAYYHIYNCGIDKREIFLDDEDYTTFMSYLTFYLTPFINQAKAGFKKDRPSVARHKEAMNLRDQVTLLAYCLMPNHFHLIVLQNISDGITKIMRRVCVNYVMYFNKKYNRLGPLFTGVYKAAKIESDDQLIHVSRYLHLKPIKKEVYKIGPVRMRSTSNPADYTYSSCKFYFSDTTPSWLNTVLINNISGYKYRQFVMDLTIDTEHIYPQLLLDI